MKKLLTADLQVIPQVVLLADGQERKQSSKLSQAVMLIQIREIFGKVLELL